MKRAILLFCLLLSLLPEAAGQPSDLRSFRIYAPSGTITQGDRIQVKYVLEASQYRISGFDGGIDRAVLEKVDLVKPEGYEDKDYFHVEVHAVFRITGTGPLRVHGMSALIGEERVKSDSLLIDVLPNPGYGQEWELARSFLQSREALEEKDRLEYKYGTKTLCAFSDATNRSFAIVVRRDYQPYIENPILAYGIGNSMWSGDDKAKDNSIYHILSRYEEQLEGLRKRRQVYRSLPAISYKPLPSGVRPLLGRIEYGQGAPYNALLPKDKFEGRDSTCLAGCGPVALAQVLTFHRNPVLPQGTGTFSLKSGKEFRVNMKDHPVVWGPEEDLSALMLDCVASVMAKLSPTATSSSLSNFKAGLIDYWDYSPSCTWVNDYGDADMLEALYYELDRRRPVIVADENHLFVVDGYDGEFFHLNLGWKGYCNGYYRALVVPGVSGRQLPFTEMLIGIRPMEKGDAITAKVRVKKPGTLAKLLSKKKPEQVTKLTVTGTLDGDDIRVLRTLAGAVDRLDGASPTEHGSLMELDLSKATIVAGKAYARVPAAGKVLSGSVTKNGKRFEYRYEMSKLTEKDWREIREWGLDQSGNIRIGRTDDGTPYLELYAADGVIGSQMFGGCGNLRTLWLPRSATEVEYDAFYECRALEKVHNLPRKVAENAFRYTPHYKQ